MEKAQRVNQPAPDPSTAKPGLPRVLIPLALAALAAVALFDPAQHGWFPQCTLKKLTGWSCPTCGVLRGTHALLHGDFALAARFNPLIFLLGVPLVVAAALAWFRPQALAAIPSTVKWSLAAVAILFAVAFVIVRNLYPELGWNS